MNENTIWYQFTTITSRYACIICCVVNERKYNLIPIHNMNIVGRWHSWLCSQWTKIQSDTNSQLRPQGYEPCERCVVNERKYNLIPIHNTLDWGTILYPLCSQWTKIQSDTNSQLQSPANVTTKSCVVNERKYNLIPIHNEQQAFDKVAQVV